MQPFGPDHVANVMSSLNLNIKIRHFDDSTATSELAADAVGCELGQIVKSLCFMVDGSPLLVLASGDQVVDDRKLASMHEVGRKKVKFASAEQCVTIFGYEPGGVAPFGHRTPDIPVLIDQSLGRYDQVYAAAGTHNTIFPIDFALLVDKTGGQVADVVK